MNSRMIGAWIAGSLAIATVLSSPAVAQQVDVQERQEAASVEAARDGAVAPLLLSAALGSSRALALGNVGYDTARSGALSDSTAEVRVWGPVAVRASVTYSDDTRRMRPSVGARLQLLRQSAHGVDGSLMSVFKTEGFSETEGEIESTFAIGRRFEQVYLLGNVAYGQDPEGNERDGELRAAVLRPEGRAVIGLEARGRAAIGPQHGTHAVEPRFDAVGGALGIMPLSTFILFAEVGPSVVKLAGADVRWGVASVGGVAALF